MIVVLAYSISLAHAFPGIAYAYQAPDHFDPADCKFGMDCELSGVAVGKETPDQVAVAGISCDSNGHCPMDLTCCGWTCFFFATYSDNNCEGFQDAKWAIGQIGQVGGQKVKKSAAEERALAAQDAAL